MTPEVKHTEIASIITKLNVCVLIVLAFLPFITRIPPYFGTSPVLCGGPDEFHAILLIAIPLILAFLSFLVLRRKDLSLRRALLTVASTTAIYLIFIFIIFPVSGASYECGANLETACIPSPGFLCEDPVIASSGTLSVLIGQDAQLSPSGTTYNSAIACVQYSSNMTTPSANGSIVFNSIEPSGAVGTNIYSTGTIPGTILSPGAQLTITGLQCYGTSGPYSKQPIGSVFNGWLWLAYNQTSNTGKDNNFAKIATASLKVTS